MTTTLGAISSNRNTKPISTPQTTIMSNHTLNAILQGFLDKDVVFEDSDDFINDDGAVDDDKLEAYMARQEEEEERKRNLLLTLMQKVQIEDLEQREVDAEVLRRHRQRFLGQRKKRRKFKRQWYCDPVTGKMRRVTPKLSGWWLDYIENPEPDFPSWNKGVRQRFKLPYWSFVEILEWVSGDGCDGLFDRWRTQADGYTGRKNNKKVSPIELLLLGTLRYLGRGWTFDDIEDCTKVSREVHRCFFTRSRHLVRNFFTHGSYICRIRLPTYKIVSPSTPWLGFPDVSEVPMRRISHLTRSLLHFGKPTLGTRWGRKQQLRRTI